GSEACKIFKVLCTYPYLHELSRYPDTVALNIVIQNLKPCDNKSLMLELMRDYYSRHKTHATWSVLEFCLLFFCKSVDSYDFQRAKTAEEAFDNMQMRKENRSLKVLGI